MPVSQVRDGMAVEPNHIYVIPLYVIPPNTNMGIEGGRLKLPPRTVTRGQHMPSDAFMRSLAGEQGSRAIGVILSGTASDGALGLEAIKAEGGIAFAQEERSARYDGMPRSAIATGCVDFVLPPEGIAQEIENIVLDVSAERLRRFFVKVDRGYQISRTIREMCVFARQDLIKPGQSG